ncbi:hypothetical protein JMI89_11305 [Frischella sp. Ac48]|uniref:helix-turn-helix domain-containing protein n=1 Tax=Frischella sp. Ac48 TaxID=2804531 RepID=UPI001C7E1547|nr:helix-turn-helix domain-containing protein [Frischella sp. Ac48]MBX4134212.1 hypothetical protein [Frischella sp. Ac48]
MVKNVNAEFKQQAIDYVLSNTYLSISKLANHLGVSKSTHDKWGSQFTANKTSHRKLIAEQQRNIGLEKISKRTENSE